MRPAALLQSRWVRRASLRITNRPLPLAWRHTLRRRGVRPLASPLSRPHAPLTDPHGRARAPTRPLQIWIKSSGRRVRLLCVTLPF